MVMHKNKNYDMINCHQMSPMNPRSGQLQRVCSTNSQSNSRQ